MGLKIQVILKKPEKQKNKNFSLPININQTCNKTLSYK